MTLLTKLNVYGGAGEIKLWGINQGLRGTNHELLAQRLAGREAGA